MSRHVLVTGATGGIGAAIVRTFVRCGDRVTAVDVRTAESESISAPQVQCLTADLSDPACGAVLDHARALHGPIDVLVNAAGIYPATRLADMTAKAWDIVQAINVRAPMLLTVALTAAGRPASVVNITSGAALRTRPGAAHYCASKAALEMLTKSCALEFAAQQIRVNAVSPGFIAVDSAVNPVTPAYAAAAGANPIGRPGHPDDIAAAVAWLAGPDASFVTGAILRVDGGSSIGSTALPIHHPSVTELQRGTS